jgi:RHS repeat-associated protein
MGNRASMTDLVGLHNYSYDDIYQVTQAVHPNLPTEPFSYDATGNRLGTTVDDANALLEDSDYIYTYDYADNLIQKVRKSDNQTTVYTYDYENRLKRVQYPGMDAQYKYDAFGRRIERNVNGQITTYLYDGMNIVTDFTGGWNTLKSKYVHSLAIDDPLSVEQGANIYYYHKDGLGSVTELTDSTGNVVKTYDYKGFGEIHTQTGTVVQPFAFTSREFDSESGLYFYRGRYYDPKAGRFINRDPIGFAGGDVNLFRYVQNNPVNNIDPFSLVQIRFLKK